MKRIRTYAAAALLAGSAFAGGMTLAGGNASAASATTETVSQVNTMISGTCYREVRTERTYYSHSAGHGWKPLPAPRVSVTTSTHCYAR